MPRWAADCNLEEVCFWEALPAGQGYAQTALLAAAQLSHAAGHPCQLLAAPTCLATNHPSLQAKRPQLRTWLDRFGEVYSKAVVGAAVALLAGLLATGVPLLGAAGQVRMSRVGLTAAVG